MLFGNLLEKIKGLMLVHSNSIKANDDRNAADTASAIEKLTDGVSHTYTKMVEHDSKLDHIIDALDGLKAQQEKNTAAIETIAQQTAKKERAPRKKNVTEEVPTTGEIFNQNMDVNPEAVTMSEAKPVKNHRYTEEQKRFIIEKYPKMKTENLIVAFENEFGIRRSKYGLQKFINEVLGLAKHKRAKKNVEPVVKEPKAETVTKVPKKRGKKPIMTEEQSNLSIELFFEGMNFTKIGQKLGLAPYLIRDNIRRKGIKVGDFTKERSKANLSLPLRSNTKYTQEENNRIRYYIDKHSFTAKTIGIIMRRTTDAIKCQGRNLGYSTKNVGKTTIFTKSAK